MGRCLCLFSWVWFVLAVCNFDMQFIFVVAGWEGNAHDARIFLTTMRNHALNFPKPPKGMTRDIYPQMDGYLGPYKGERYHLPDFRQGSQPTGHQEVFNHTHSSLRSVIERTFGVLKKRWKILRDMPSYPFDKQVKIVIVNMAIHNYIRRHAKHDHHFEKIENDPGFILEEDNERDDDFQEENHNANTPTAREVKKLRDSIAESLMRAWHCPTKTTMTF
ncbi:hypothetical protein EZV62_000944 [Acer yangbiense]|uniref:DDE Tnp4 domain-containing protein n=1 Tax=Acer yangbiense TaxID=1000413 RepID=A0A5C7IT48_9ROSI|nr:hypothetical protein EZV62_000944 [Acer yangbiense]